MEDVRGYEPFLRTPPEMAFRNEIVAYVCYEVATTRNLDDDALMVEAITERHERREEALERMGWPDAPVPRSPADEEESPGPFCLYRRRSSTVPGLAVEVYVLTFGRARIHLSLYGGPVPESLAEY